MRHWMSRHEGRTDPRSRRDARDDDEGAFAAIGRPGGGRHGHGRGFGRGFGFGGDGEHDGFTRGRKLGSDDLQLLLLLLLAEKPAHGYELIRILGERSGGFYTPSPGMVYPALTFLDEIGHAEASADGNRKLYTITEAGRIELDANRVRAEELAETLRRIGARMEGVRDAFSGVGDADPAASEELHRARHALKHALVSRRGRGADEARRIARILDEAASAILKGPLA